MQLTIDLTNQPPAYGKRVIAMIEAFYGLAPSNMKGTYELTITADTSQAVSSIKQLEEAAATVPSVPTPLPPAPSTAAADLQPTVPVVTPVSSPEPSVPPAPAAPTAPTAAAPTAPVAPTSPAGVVLDTDGLPWDARIHSSSKAKNADGRWRAKKGLNDGGLVARVQAELRAVMAVPARGEIGSPEMNAALAADAQKLIAMGVDPLTGEVFASTPAVMPPPVPEVPAVAAPFVPPPPPLAPIAPPIAPPAILGVSTAAPTADPTTMPELMPRVTGAMATGQIPPTAMLDACKAVGLPDLPSLAHRPDLIPQVWATLKASHPGVWS